MAHSNTLISLPEEIQLDIIYYLDFPDDTCLRMTCKRFYQLTKPLTLTHDKLLEFENSDFATTKDFYPCFSCRRLRKKSKFLEPMVTRKMRRQGRDAHRRYCLECMQEKGPYAGLPYEKDRMNCGKIREPFMTKWPGWDKGEWDI